MVRQPIPITSKIAIGDLDGAALGNLRVWEREPGIHRLMPQSSLLVMHGWCSPIGRATKAESGTSGDSPNAECRVMSPRLATRTQGRRPDDCRSRERLEAWDSQRGSLVEARMALRSCPRPQIRAFALFAARMVSPQSENHECFPKWF